MGSSIKDVRTLMREGLSNDADEVGEGEGVFSCKLTSFSETFFAKEEGIYR